MNTVTQEKDSRSDSFDYYSDSFYKEHMDGSYNSAVKYVELLNDLYKPHSVVDFGCGRGTWLKAFKDVGAEELVGFDGTWNNQSHMIDQSILFHAVDLNSQITLDRESKFDLAMSLEVAEHLEESSSRTFIESIVKLSDVVMFGAAYTNQGGTNHINEQPHSYWAKIFMEHDYFPYDIFRPSLWGNKDVMFWYQQNTFLYVKSGSPLIEKLSSVGYRPIRNLAFMNCVHPSLYSSRISLKHVLKRTVKNALPIGLLPYARKIKSIFD
jgi:hypothetical protein